MESIRNITIVTVMVIILLIIAQVIQEKEHPCIKYGEVQYYQKIGSMIVPVRNCLERK